MNNTVLRLMWIKCVNICVLPVLTDIDLEVYAQNLHAYKHIINLIKY